MFDWSILDSYAQDFCQGFILTISFSFLSMPVSFFLGSLLALMVISHLAILRLPAIVFVEIFRNVPFLIQVYIIYFGLPALGISIPVLGAGIISLSLLGTAFFTETIRGAILSVAQGQLEAARSIGMSYRLAMRRIVFPQMFAYLLPPTGNHLIMLVKASSILSVISIAELTHTAQRLTNITYSPIEVYTIVSLLYWGINAFLEAGVAYAQRRLKWHGLGSPGVRTLTRLV